MPNTALFDKFNRKQQEWLLMISACLLQLNSGLTISGPVFANAMRISFGLSQSELDVAMDLQLYGAVLMFASGLVYDRWGPRITVAVGGISSTLASLAVTLAFGFPSMFYARPWSMWILLFIYGHAFNYGEVTAITATVAGFSFDRRGTALAVVENCFCLGPMVSSLLHYLVFGNMFRSPDSQNALGTLAVQNVFTAVSYAFAFIFVGQPRSTEPSELTPIVLKEDSGTEKEDFPQTPSSVMGDDSEIALSSWERGETSGEYLRATLYGCLNWPFIFLLVGFSLGIAQNYAVWLNVTTITRSLAISQTDLAFVLVPLFLALPFRIAIGYLSDKFFSEVHRRAGLLTVCVSVFGIPTLLLITVHWLPGSSPLGVTLSSYILSELVVAMLLNLGLVVLSQIIPQSLFGRMHSVCLFIGTGLSLPLTLQFGIIYDTKAAAFNNVSVSTNNGTTGRPICLGQDCYTTGNIANAVCMFGAAACFLALTVLLCSSTAKSNDKKNFQD